VKSAKNGGILPIIRETRAAFSAFHGRPRKMRRFSNRAKSNFPIDFKRLEFNLIQLFSFSRSRKRRNPKLPFGFPFRLPDSRPWP
jgi:hypothetical protein